MNSMDILYAIVFATVGMMAIAGGIMLTVKPELRWRRERWKHNGTSEPSEAFLQMSALHGVMMIIMGIFMLLLFLDCIGVDVFGRTQAEDVSSYEYPTERNHPYNEDEVPSWYHRVILNQYASNSDMANE